MNKIFIALVLHFTICNSIAQEITATQKFPADITAGKEYTVETTINKGASKNFIMFSQPIPLGFNVTDIDSKGGRLKFVDTIVKVTWIMPPTEETFTFSYKLSVPQKTPNEMMVQGSVYYIVDSAKKEFKLPQKTIKIEGGQAEVKQDIPVVETKTVAVKEVPPAIKPIKTESIPASGRTYKIQIGVFKTKHDFKNVPELSSYEAEGGLIKYYSGNYPTKEAAIKHLAEINTKGFKTAFVVAFENGKVVK